MALRSSWAVEVARTLRSTARALRRGSGKRRGLRDVASVLAAAAIALSARSSLADHYVVPSGSMEPTVHVGDRIFVDKLAYGVRIPLADVYAIDGTEPARGDVVVLASPEDATVLLKRVVAVPGDVVRVVDGRVSIDGVSAPIVERDGGLVEELGAATHAVDLDSGGGPDFGPVRVPPRRFLVLGDNRGNSKDGRFFGLVDRDAIKGRAARVFARDGRMAWIGL
jgi:signal peptidase I